MKIPVRISYLLDYCITFKSQFVIIVEIAELLFRNLNTAGARDVIDAALLEEIVKHVTLLLEAGCANFTAVIQKVHAEKFAFAIFVVPGFDIGFARAARFDCPFIGVWRDSFNGINGGVSGRGMPSHRLCLMGRLWRGTPLELRAVKSIAGDGGGLRLFFFLFAFGFQRFGFADFLCLAQLWQNLKIQNNQDSKLS